MNRLMEHRWNVTKRVGGRPRRKHCRSLTLSNTHRTLDLNRAWTSAQMIVERNAYRILIGKTEKKGDLLECLQVDEKKGWNVLKV